MFKNIEIEHVQIICLIPGIANGPTSREGGIGRGVNLGGGLAG